MSVCLKCHKMYDSVTHNTICPHVSIYNNDKKKHEVENKEYLSIIAHALERLVEIEEKREARYERQNNLLK